MKNRPWILSFVLCLFLTTTLQAENPATTEAIFPFFVEGTTKTEEGKTDVWNTTFLVFNPNPSTTAVTLALFDPSGRTRLTKSIAVLGLQFQRVKIDSLENVTGWAKIQADQPIVASEEIEHFRFTGNAWALLDRKSRISLTPALRIQRKFISVEWEEQTLRQNTGLAIVLPSTRDELIRGKLVFRWIDGRFVTERSFTLPTNQQLVGLFTDLLPESRNFSPLGTLASGSIEVIFDKPVAVVAVHVLIVGADFEELSEPLSGHFEIQK